MNHYASMLRVNIIVVIDIIMGSLATASAQDVLPPKWTTGCDAKGKDAFGDSQRRYSFFNAGTAFLMVNITGLPQYNPDFSWLLNGEVIIEIDASGEHVLNAMPGRYCSTKPRRLAVDQKAH